MLTQDFPVDILNKALKEVGAQGHVISITVTPTDRSRPAREQRRMEYNGLMSLPFYSVEQAERLRILKLEVVDDNHAAFDEDKSIAAPDSALGAN